MDVGFLSGLGVGTCRVGGRLACPCGRKDDKWGHSRRPRRARICMDSQEETDAVEETSNLQVGDLTKHEKYGIGRFVGMQSTYAEGSEYQEFAVLDYRDGDLLVPMSQLDLLKKVTNESGTVKLDNLISVNAYMESATQRKVRAKKLQRDREKIRQRILVLHGFYASRTKLTRDLVEENPELEEVFSSSFEYQLTKGQDNALSEILNDLSARRRPMDRLLCGDVGFGKTEVSFRAALRVILAGGQVALLCPTTILATQHYNNAVERFQCLPEYVKLGRLSRFVPKKEQTATIAGLKDGSINFVIATHSLLNENISFAKLGLLIIDEEHRFGVGQKEQIRSRYKLLDMLSLSATPIPRTLHLSMSGLRDVSVINTPPENRLPIITKIAPFGKSTLQRAIGFELARGGQVFYVVRVISGIQEVARGIKDLFPDKRIIVAHGRSKDLEKRINFFTDRKADILVCTTIIETGVDLPHVNTIIIEEPEHMGLAQLHQLRGRVGRSKEQGYAWLLHKGSRTVVSERLHILQQCSGLGSGFEVAQKDLELRGMGSVLGFEQSGKATSLEPTDYARMLAEEIALAKQDQLKVLPPLPEVQTTEIFLPVDSLIPREYIKDDELRLEAYFELARAKSRVELLNLSDRLARIWGPIPLKLQQFVCLLELKMFAKSLGISRIASDKPHIVLEWEVASRTVEFLITFLVEKRDRDRFDSREDDGRVVLRGLGMLEGDIQVAKLRNWLEIFVKCVEEMRLAESTSPELAEIKHNLFESAM